MFPAWQFVNFVLRLVEVTCIVYTLYIYIYYDFIILYIMYTVYNTYIYILRGTSLSFPWHSVFVTPKLFLMRNIFLRSHHTYFPLQKPSKVIRFTAKSHDSNPNETKIKCNFASPSLGPKNIQKSTHAMRLFFGVKKFKEFWVVADEQWKRAPGWLFRVQKGVVLHS